MAERVVTGYKRLFEVRVLHHYWLDEGGVVFDALAEDIRNKRLLTYDVRPFLDIAPTESTAGFLKGLRCVFKNTALGLVVAAPKDISVPANAVFEFVMRVQHADFFNYTALTFLKQQISELYYQPEDKIRRFKENVFVFSNDGGTSKALYTPSKTVLFLSKPIPAYAASTVYKAESLVGSLYQALKDLPTSSAPPSAGWQAVANSAGQPVFVHQDDVPVLVPPAGLTGVPKRGIELTNDLPDDLFALIRIKTLLPASNFSLLKISPPPQVVLREPVFEIRFKTRLSVWKYIDKTTKVAVPNSGGLYPLTHFGNAYEKAAPDPTPAFVKRQKPSVHSIEATLDTSDPPNITGLVSEIFI